MIVFFLHYLESYPLWSLSHEAHLRRVLFLALYGNPTLCEIQWYNLVLFIINFFFLGYLGPHLLLFLRNLFVFLSSLRLRRYIRSLQELLCLLVNMVGNQRLF